MRLHFLVTRKYSSVAKLAILGLITLIYWPVLSAGFIWDDNFFLHDSAWVSSGDHWIQVVLHGFAEWDSYYRPLGVALFALEARAFDQNPMPMHALSLFLHLVNVLLVGSLAKRLLKQAKTGTESTGPVYIAMLIFGLHPALIEPAAWISAQFELLVTFFTISGLILNLVVQRLAVRATGVALCFFLAACSKEAALSFPLLMVVTDWLRVAGISGPDSRTQRLRDQLSQLFKRQWPVYLAVMMAGVAYLALRVWGLGSLVNPNFKSHSDWLTQLQTVCFTYLAYWKLLIWPMSDLAPIHIVRDSFAQLSPRLLVVDACAVLLVLSGLWLLYRRHVLGYLIIAVSVALVPVLHIVPLRFDESLYHERYAMIAIGMTCAFMPIFSIHFAPLRGHSVWFARIGALAAAVWLLTAVANIRVTVPLWSDEVRLWEWGLLKNPGLIGAQEPLLSAYMRRNDIAKAQALAEIMVQGEGLSCAGCMLNIAGMYINLGDEKRATSALQQAKKDLDILYPKPRLILYYMLLSGALAELKHDDAEANEAFRSAVAFEPLDPEGHLRLAMLLAREKKFEEARAAADTAFKLYAPDERAERKKKFDQVLAASISASKER